MALIVNTQKRGSNLHVNYLLDIARGRICFSAHSMIGQPIGGADQGDNRQVRAPCKK